MNILKLTEFLKKIFTHRIHETIMILSNTVENIDQMFLLFKEKTKIWKKANLTLRLKVRYV